MDVRGFAVGSVKVFAAELCVTESTFKSLIEEGTSLADEFYDRFNMLAGQDGLTCVYGPESLAFESMGLKKKDGEMKHVYTMRGLVGKLDEHNWRSNPPTIIPGTDQFNLAIHYDDALNYFTNPAKAHEEIIARWVDTAFHAGEVPLDSKYVSISEIPAKDLSQGVPLLVSGPVAQRRLLIG